MSQRELGQLLTRMEREASFAHSVLAGLPRRAASTRRLGLTGSPGVGKSTLVGKLLSLLRSRGERVGVIAVDPTSPLSGGALLGDRLRLAPAQDDPGTFIRSLGSRGSLGGITPAASGVAAVLEAAGYDRILIETVGVGQTGYDVICLADTVLSLFSPESGDGLQLMKAGILEIGDLLVVNKADRPGAEALLKELELSVALSYAAAEAGEWRPPVRAVVASTGEGLSELLDQVDAHATWLASLPDTHERRLGRIARELAFVIGSEAELALSRELLHQREALALQVQHGELKLWEAVAVLRSKLAELLAGSEASVS